MRKPLLFLFAFLLSLSPQLIFAGNGLSPTNNHPRKAYLESVENDKYLVDPLTEMEIAAFAATPPVIHERQTHPGGIILLILAIAGLFLFPVILNAFAPHIVKKLSAQ